jgi:hypothetical protein
MPFEQKCDQAFLQYMMFCMYSYGNSLDNPLHESIRTHFTTLAERYPSTMFFLTLATESGAHKVGILPSDFVDGVLSDEHLNLLLWKVRMIQS